MTFQYTLASDLHLDHPNKEGKLSNMTWRENVIIAGDIGNGLGHFRFLERLQEGGRRVLAVPGNHEHYVQDGMSLQERERAFFQKMGHTRCEPLADGLTFIGACGWYRIEDELHWRNSLNDARYVSMAEVNLAAEIDAMQIEYELDNCKGKAIVVTHMAPCMETLDPRYEGHSSNAYFHNPLLRGLLPKYADKIAVWHHGHTHRAMNMVVDGVHVITNPRGYPGENIGWEPLQLEV